MPEMLIGGEWRAAAAEEQLEVVNPATEEVVDIVPAGTPEDVDLAVATAKRAFADWSRDRRREARRDPGQGRRPDPRARQGARGDAHLRAGQAAGGGDRRGHPPRPRRALLRRGRDQGPRRLPGPPVHARARLRDGDPPPDRRVRGDHALQLPADAARDQGRAGAGGGQHGGCQAGGDDAAGHARRSRACSRRPACPTACSTSSPAAARTSATRSSAIPTCAASRSPARPSVGRHVAALAAPDLKRLTLELGGSDPVIVCADADVDAAVKAVIIGRYWNAGQACLGCKRVFVHDSVYDDVRVPARRPRRPLRARRRHGEGREAEAPNGPDPHPRGPRRAARADRERRRSGGELLIGGGTGAGDKGWFLEPAVIAEPARSSRLMTRGGVRPGPAGVPLHRLRRRDRARQRHALRARLLDLDPRRAPDPPRRAGDRIRHDVGQPDPLRLRRAAVRRRQGVGIRQGARASRRSTPTSRSSRSSSEGSPDGCHVHRSRGRSASSRSTIRRRTRTTSRS